MDRGLFNNHALAATGEEATLTRKLKLNRLGILQFLFDEQKLVITTSDARRGNKQCNPRRHKSCRKINDVTYRDFIS